LSGKQVVAALLNAGFDHVSIKGSHAKLRPRMLDGASPNLTRCRRS
jgi:predicted RNA binding protein YcfA (HicA-like mRNA interferase family)